MKSIFIKIVLLVAVIFVVAAGVLKQDGWDWLKPFAGATLAIFAPVSMGVLLGFFLGFDVNEPTLLGKFMKIGLGLCTGASLALISSATGVAQKYVPIAANELHLGNWTLVLLCPTFFVPAFIGTYLLQTRDVREGPDLIDLFQELLSPQSTAKVFLGDTTRRQDKLLERYEREENELLERYEDSIPPLVSAMSLYHRSGDYDGALRVLERYQPTKRDRGQVYFAMGASLLKLGRYDEALKCFNGIEDTQGFEPGINKFFAECYLNVGKLEEAKKFCSKYLEDHPNREAVKLQLRILRGMYDSAKTKKEKPDMISEARDFANKMIKKKIVQKREINGMWPGLISEEVNG